MSAITEREAIALAAATDVLRLVGELHFDGTQRRRFDARTIARSTRLAGGGVDIERCRGGSGSGHCTARNSARFQSETHAAQHLRIQTGPRTVALSGGEHKDKRQEMN